MKSKSPRHARLLLPLVKRKPEKAKLAVSISTDVHADLIAYQRAYQDMNQGDVSFDFIVEHVLMQHMKRDKAFQTWKVTQPKD
jgi:hypothetical protein